MGSPDPLEIDYFWLLRKIRGEEEVLADIVTKSKYEKEMTDLQKKAQLAQAANKKMQRSQAKKPVSEAVKTAAAAEPDQEKKKTIEKPPDYINYPESRFGYRAGPPDREDRSMDDGFVKVPFTKIQPFITEQDISDDRKSLYRKLTKRLYLIVKKPRTNHQWQFPQGLYDDEDESVLRETAQRELKKEFGKDLNVHWLGNAPMGHYSYHLPAAEKTKYSADATKVFFFKGVYLHGNVKLNSLQDYLWVTRRELKEYFDPEYYKYVETMLPLPPFD